jgi:organic hydroperoxide reductase OsmC/OhrA
MGTVKALRYPVHSHWYGGRVVHATATDKRPLQVATPPEFRGGVKGIWSPEELLVAAVASCYELTLAAIAERRRVPLSHVETAASGHLEHGHDGYRFTVIDLDVHIVTDPTHEQEAKELALLTKDHCIVGKALDAPIHVDVTVVPHELEHPEVASDVGAMWHAVR